MQKKLRIALISRYYPPDPGGGLALYTRQIAEEFAAMGHKVVVLASDVGGMPNKFKRDEPHPNLTLMRIPQYKVYRRSLTGLTCLANSVQIAYHLEQLHHEAPLDVIQCPATFFESFYYGRWLKPVLKVPLVIKFHENGDIYRTVDGRLKSVKALRRHWMRRFMRTACQSADYWMGVSKHALDTSLSYLGLSDEGRSQGVSPSPIDLNQFRPCVPRPGMLEGYGLDSATPFLFFSGRLIREKGVLLLLDTFLDILSTRYPSLCLVIAGEPDYRQADVSEKLKKRIQEHPAGARVRFLGRVPYEEMPYWYSACTVFVAPSRSEPFGRIYVEAMACGAPVVGVNHAGPQEIIRNFHDGLLVDEQTPEALASGITMILDTPEFQAYLREQGRLKVERHYDSPQVAASLVETYRQIIAENLVRQRSEASSDVSLL